MLIEIIVGIIIAAFLIFLGLKIFPTQTFSMWRNGLVIAALIYVVFAMIGKNFDWIQIEIVGVLLYGFFAWLATEKSVLFLAVGWGLHVFWDLLLHPSGAADHVPNWYPGVCLGFDLVIAGYFIWYFLEEKKKKISA